MGWVVADLDAVGKAHRLLAPRIAYLVGTRSPDDVPNVIPVSNVTSVSTEPQHVLLAVHKQWTTYQNLLTVEGFTVSVPLFDQLDGVWRLGAKYSRFPVVDSLEKITASGLAFDGHASRYGPVLADGIGWLDCQIVARSDLDGDHGIIVGAVTATWFNPAHLNADGTPRGEVHPLMQWTGNVFATPGLTRSIPFYD